MRSIYVMSVKQPIGYFYIGKIDAKDLIRISKVQRRDINDNTGIQRSLDKGRANKIEEYINDPDATFPTSIILSIDPFDIIEFKQEDRGLFKLTFNEQPDKPFAEIIDGQHRIEGIKKNPDAIEELPIVVMFSMSQEEKAYVFSVINSNQKSVPKSVIYDLFELYEGRSPIKTCHTIVKALNTDESSPLYRRIRMLEKRESSSETISQGMFVNYLVALISRNPDNDQIILKRGGVLERDDRPVLRNLFIDELDDIIYKVILNYFSAVANVFSDDWNKETSNLVKTTGIGALCKVFPKAYELGASRSDLTEAFFTDLFELSKDSLINANKQLNAKDFGSGEQSQKELAKILIENW